MIIFTNRLNQSWLHPTVNYFRLPNPASAPTYPCWRYSLPSVRVSASSSPLHPRCSSSLPVLATAACARLASLSFSPGSSPSCWDLLSRSKSKRWAASATRFKISRRVSAAPSDDSPSPPRCSCRSCPVSPARIRSSLRWWTGWRCRCRTARPRRDPVSRSKSASASPSSLGCRWWTSPRPGRTLFPRMPSSGCCSWGRAPCRTGGSAAGPRSTAAGSGTHPLLTKGNFHLFVCLRGTFARFYRRNVETRRYEPLTSLELVSCSH